MRIPGGKGYWLAAAVLLALAYLYIERRDLSGRQEEYFRTEATMQANREELEQLREEVAESRERVEDLRNDPVAVERSIRQWNHMVREGERVYRLQAIPTAPDELPVQPENGVDEHRTQSPS